jgi:hypothetical protein
MEYKGKLYGRIGETLLPLEMTTDDVESLKVKADKWDALEKAGQPHGDRRDHPVQPGNDPAGARAATI